MSVSSINGAPGTWQLGASQRDGPQESQPQDTPQPSDDRPTTVAAHAASGRRPVGPPPGGPPPGGRAEDVSSTEDDEDDELTPLEQLAAELGVDSETLLEQLQQVDVSSLTGALRWSQGAPTGGFAIDVQA